LGYDCLFQKEEEKTDFSSSIQVMDRVKIEFFKIYGFLYAKEQAWVRGLNSKNLESEGQFLSTLFSS
jgi:hypothetical protein